ncbi:hypothetical protein [Sphaerisporangium fuscum]|uniref:hypothetical protein n=1 Tax=Sphaerisporangium fuscum TaxID=2835868 RepID=UPI001BDBDFD2|nr:hypothetical protein [Sphaerisporangium fuscum]
MTAIPARSPRRVRGLLISGRRVLMAPVPMASLRSAARGALEAAVFVVVRARSSPYLLLRPPPRPSCALSP